jgi:ribosomal protein L9
VRLPGGPIRLIGEHHVKLHLHSDVEIDLPVTITAED